MDSISLIDMEYRLGRKNTKDLIAIYYYEVFKQKYYTKTLYVGHVTKTRRYTPDDIDAAWHLCDDSEWNRAYPYGVEYDPTTNTYGNCQKLPYVEAQIETSGKHTMLWLKNPDEGMAKQLLADFYEAKLAKVNKKRDKLLATLAELK